MAISILVGGHAFNAPAGALKPLLYVAIATGAGMVLLETGPSLHFLFEGWGVLLVAKLILLCCIPFAWKPPIHSSRRYRNCFHRLAHAGKVSPLLTALSKSHQVKLACMRREQEQGRQRPCGDVRLRGFSDRASFKEAIAWLDAHGLPGLPAKESLQAEEIEIDTDAARGRVLAAPISAPVDVPGVDCAAVDGYALRSGEPRARAITIHLLSRCTSLRMSRCRWLAQ